MQGYRRDVTVIPKRQASRDRIVSLPITAGTGALYTVATQQQEESATFQVKSTLFPADLPNERFDYIKSD